MDTRDDVEMLCTVFDFVTVLMEERRVLDKLKNVKCKEEKIGPVGISHCTHTDMEIWTG